MLHRNVEITPEHAAWFADERARAVARMPEDWKIPKEGQRQHDHRVHVLMERPEMRFRGIFDFAVDV